MSAVARASCQPSTAPAKGRPPCARKPAQDPGPHPGPAAGAAFAQDLAIDLAHIPIHAPLRISSPGDAAEREADRAAERVMRGERVDLAGAATPALARKCTACDKADGDAAVAAALAAPGRPLDGAVRGAFEPRFGRSFANVRVHADAAADRAARAIDARAFTFRDRIGFAADEYAPRTFAGQSLLAHELAHVAQQRRGPSECTIYRFPYETAGITLSRANVVNRTGASYWLLLTTDRYDLVLDQRMASDQEERDAVLAALWAQNPPATVTAASERVVPIQARPAAGNAPAAPALLYRFQFSPPTTRGGKPGLSVEFIASGPDSFPVAAPAPATGFTAPPVNANNSGFPGSIAAYLTAHPQENAQLASFIAAAPATFDQVVTAATRSGTATTHRSIFHVIRTGPGPTNLTVHLVSQGSASAAATVPADYRSHDAAEFDLGKLRATSRAAANRLGTVTLPAGLAADERTAVNLAVGAYFDTGGARNTEVDAIVPVGAARSVLFTLRFGAGNNVTVERIGEAGTGAGQVNTGRIDVTRVNGFPGATAADPALRSWWTTRYRLGGALATPAPAAATPGRSGGGGSGTAASGNVALVAEMNRLIAAGSASATWFQNNYNIEVMDATATATRLQTTHGVPATLTGDTIALAAADLTLLEISLQTLGSGELQRLAGVKLGRKSASIKRSGTGWQAGPASLVGLTLTASSGTATERTVLYFTDFRMNEGALFRGGSGATALPDPAMTVLHELGHATEHDAGIEAAFDAWRQAHPPTAPTWYAASDPGAELFPEAYALFHTDPHFLCSTAPLMYAWFLQLSRTGSAPAASAALTAPTTCPP